MGDSDIGQCAGVELVLAEVAAVSAVGDADTVIVPVGPDPPSSPQPTAVTSATAARRRLGVFNMCNPPQPKFEFVFWLMKPD